MIGKIVLVTGGARSGKSVFAEKYAASVGGRVAYIATAQIYDEEMRLRIELHRKRRPDTWETFEAPYRAEQAMAEAVTTANVVLFDCLTVYTSNLLLAAENYKTAEERCCLIMAQIDALLTSASADTGVVIFVTNEVGMGIVPENALAREYRDLAGSVNQKVAEAADEVYLVVCGLAVEIKKLAANLGKEV